MLQRSNKENSFLLPKTPGGIMEGPAGKTFKSTMNTGIKPVGKRIETGAPIQLCSTKKSVAFTTPTEKNDLRKALATPRTILGGKDNNVRQHQTPGMMMNTALKGKPIKEDPIDDWEVPNNMMTGRTNGAPGMKSQTMVFVDQQEPQTNEADNDHMNDEIEFIPDPVSPLPFTPFLSDDEGEDIFCNVVSPDKRDLSQPSQKEQIDYNALSMACRNPRYKVTNNDEDNILDGPLSNLLKVWNLDIDKLPEEANFQSTSPSKVNKFSQTNIAQHNKTHVHSKPATTPLNRMRVQSQSSIASNRRIDRARTSHPYQRLPKTPLQKQSTVSENSRLKTADKVPSYMKLTASTMAKSRHTNIKPFASKPTLNSRANNSRVPVASNSLQRSQVHSNNNRPVSSIHSMARIVNSSQKINPPSVTTNKTQQEEIKVKDSVDFNDFADDFGSDIDLEFDQDLNIDLDL